jgi:hypothetical protein
MRRDRTRAARLLLAASCLGLAAAQANGPPSFVAGDVIVKFTDASDAGQAVARAMRAGEMLADVAPVAARLSAELGIPLVAARVTSGRELVLSVDRGEVAQTLTQRLGRDPSVRSVTPVDPPKTVLPALQIQLAVGLAPDSEAQRRVQQAAQAGRETTAEIDALVARMAGGVEPRPAGRVTERGRLMLTIDVAALTRELVERLKRRQDVEYAQPVQVVRPYGGAR